MKAPIGGAFKPENEHVHRLGSMQTVDFPMRRYSENEEIDYIIVGVGSAGGVLLQRLARAGFKVVGMEAGPFWDTERDWVSDEAGSHQLYWEDLRITGGKIRSLSERITAAKASAAAPCTGQHSPRVFILRISRSIPVTGRVRTGLSHTGTSNRITSCWNWRCLSPGRRGIHGAIRMVTPSDRTRWEVWATL